MGFERTRTKGFEFPTFGFEVRFMTPAAEAHLPLEDTDFPQAGCPGRHQSVSGGVNGSYS
jgi:hypothetical protein